MPIKIKARKTSEPINSLGGEIASLKKAKVNAQKNASQARNNTHGFSSDQVEEIRARYEKGMTQGQIARELGVAQHKISYLSKKMGWKFGEFAKAGAEAKKALNDQRKEKILENALAIVEKYGSFLIADEYELVHAGLHKTRVDKVPRAPGSELRDVATGLNTLLKTVRDLEELNRAREENTSAIETFLIQVAPAESWEDALDEDRQAEQLWTEED